MRGKANISVVKAILDIMQSPLFIEFVKDRLGHDFRYSLNCDKIYNLTGWRAKIKFEAGIEKTIQWYYDNADWAIAKLEFLRKYWSIVY